MKIRELNRGEKASAYVETIMVLLVFFCLVAIVFVTAIAAFRYTILTDAVSQGLRQVSTDASAGYGGTAGLGDAAENEAQTYLRNTFGWDNANIIFQGCVQSTPASGSGASMISCRTTVTLNAKWVYNCFWCPLFGVNTWDIRVSQTRDVEDVEFRRCHNCGGVASNAPCDLP